MGVTMKFRWIGRLDPDQKLFRACSILWGRNGRDPGHRKRLSVSVRPALFHFRMEVDGWRVTVAGLRLHYKHHPLGVLV